MKCSLWIALFVVLNSVALTACRSVDSNSMPKRKLEGPQAPVAARKDHILEQHGHTRNDPYFWLNDRKNPKVISYLKAENRYTDLKMKPTLKLQKEIFQELKTRTKQDDSSVPYKVGNYFYYQRYEKGKDYPIYARKREHLKAPEEVILDVNRLARGHSYYRVGNLKVSPNENILAYAVDFKGNRIFDVFFKDLSTGKTLKKEIKGTGGNIQWANDSDTIFYNRIDPQTIRSFQVWRDRLSDSNKKSSELVYQEDDETFDVWIDKTKSRKYLLILSHQSVTSEVRLLPADQPQATPRLFQKRIRGMEYQVDHLHDRFFVLTNWDAVNFKVMTTNESRTSRAHWQDFIPHRPENMLDSFKVLKDFLVVEQRSDALKELLVKNLTTGAEYKIDFPDPAYDLSIGPNEDPQSNVLRFEYSSLGTPPSEFDYDLVRKRRTLLKQEEIFGGFRKENYKVERLFARATDGALVPISLVYRKDLFKRGKNPLIVYGYGSYGYSIDPSFNPDRLSFLDRGFVYAIAHVRGGQERGRPWYDHGKLLRKKNTFTDFIQVTEHLIATKYADPRKVYAIGRSAGGLLMGAVINLRPDLYHGIIADVPFVDVVTTMLDESIPLTTSEFDEWGNPKNKRYYHYMLSYSPYDNVVAKAYPHMLVMAGLYDSQVQYFEPAKWVAKLRATKTDDHLLLLHTNMKAGHSGGSARDQQYKENAFEMAFLVYLSQIR